MKKILYITILLLISLLNGYGQEEGQEKLIQVSGIILDESDNPVSGVMIVSRKLRKGTLSEVSGIYSITSIPGDTIYFRALGYKRYHTIIPPGFQLKRILIDISLEADTIPIAGVNIFPWKNYSEFIKDMTEEKPVDPVIENMNDNLASIYLAITNENGLKISAEAGYKYVTEQNFSAMATRNQGPVNNLLNPFAWAKFFDQVKKGLLRNKTYVKPTQSKVVKKKVKKQ